MGCCSSGSALESGRRSVVCTLVLYVTAIVLAIAIGVGMTSASLRAVTPEDYVGGRANVTYMRDQIDGATAAAGGEVPVMALLVMASAFGAHVFLVFKRLHAMERSVLPTLALYAYVAAALFALLQSLLREAFSIGIRDELSRIDLEDSLLDPAARADAESKIRALYVAMGVTIRGRGLVILSLAEALLITFAFAVYPYLTFFGSGPATHRFTKAHGVLGVVHFIANALSVILTTVILATDPGASANGPILIGLFGVGVVGYLLFVVWFGWAGFQLGRLSLPPKYTAEVDDEEMD